MPPRIPTPKKVGTPGKKREEKQPARERKKEEKEHYEVGEFVTAVYEGQWLLAQVIDQDLAGETHVNLTYMRKVGNNQFKWPKTQDQLLTLKEDILTRCCAPTLVGSSIRATIVGLSPSDATKADNALDLVQNLSSTLPKLFIFYYFFSM